MRPKLMSSMIEKLTAKLQGERVDIDPVKIENNKLYCSFDGFKFEFTRWDVTVTFQYQGQDVFYLRRPVTDFRPGMDTLTIDGVEGRHEFTLE